MASTQQNTSYAFGAIHKTASAFYRACTIDEATKPDFDESCLVIASEIKPAEIKRLQEAVKIGDESGPSIPAAAVFSELRQMIAKPG
jgi:DNA-binding transcriptional regulator YiaG